MNGRRTLFKICHACGKSFVTTADTPFVRMLPNVDGKKQKICYFCSESCKKSSYKHLWDGKAEERKRARDASRDVKEKNRKYYQTHQEEERARARRRYWMNHESALQDNRFNRKKRKAMEVQQ